MGFQKGNKLAVSRKGVKNKINNDVRQCFHKAYANMGGFDENGKLIETGDDAFLAWARHYKMDFKNRLPPTITIQDPGLLNTNQEVDCVQNVPKISQNTLK